jgi:hypothetical protein
VSDLCAAVYAHPLLGALTSTGRSAYFLAKTISSFSGNRFLSRKEEWYSALAEWTPSLIEQVAFNYTSANGISSLEESEKSRVAAWIFRCLATTKKADLPLFDGLDYEERRCAMQLLQINVEYANNKPLLMPNAARPLEVTPAIAIILFNMLGMSARMMASWRSEEELAALYAIRRWTLERIARHCWLRLRPLHRKSRKGKSTVDDFEARLRSEGSFYAYNTERISAEGALAIELSQLRCFRLQIQIQGKYKAIPLPLVSNHTVLLNGDQATFADIIAPFKLLQTKYSMQPSTIVQVKMTEELGKCCLSRASDDRVLRGLVAIWRGTLDETTGLLGTPKPSRDLRQNDEVLNSPAYPENLIKYRSPFHPVRYGVIDEVGCVRYTGQVRKLPKLDDSKDVISFILVTNVNAVQLELLDGAPLDVHAGLLRPDLQIDPLKLDPAGRGHWESFLKTIRANVRLKFLFTRQA